LLHLALQLNEVGVRCDVGLLLGLVLVDPDFTSVLLSSDLLVLYVKSVN